ncbi:SCAN domain-containing protein 3-like isoform X2 [Thalassophryne amazonica]|uniref:SCAN domain-containing protein 3-like isoform X2 n=1 Tax=Thalassophryne amazonica TaxID=390379 RepID=UPI001470F226|nr:SCAN domain-containing protein 3-like isoform X2 [Thalassophryne amazonica]
MEKHILSLLKSQSSCLLSEEKYNNIVRVLRGEPLKMERQQQHRFRHYVLKAKNFCLINFPEFNLTDVLCVPATDKQKNSSGPTLLGQYRLVAHAGQIQGILERVHAVQNNHLGYKKTLHQIQQSYSNIPRSVVQLFINLCEVCQQSRRRSKSTVHTPVLSTGFMSRVQIDLIDQRHAPDGKYNWIAHFMDHWSKFHVIWPLTSKTPKEVAEGLNTRVIPYLGLPKIFQSGNGRDFVNQLVLQLVAEWGADDAFFVNGSPKHSQSQGKYSIEEEICKCRAQAGLDGAKEYPWASWLPRIQFILNNVRSEATQQTPYELVFGHSSHSDLYSGVCVDGNVIMKKTYQLPPKWS